MNSAAFTVETTLLQSFQLEVNGAIQTLGRGQVHIQTVDDQLELLTGDLARIRISADARTLAEQRNHARDAYRAVCQQAGVVNVAAARIANRQLHEAEAERRDAQARMSRELDGISFEELQRKLADIR